MLYFWVSTQSAVRAQIQRLVLVVVLVLGANQVVSAGHQIACHRLSADLAEVHVHHGLCLGVMACCRRHYLNWRLLAQLGSLKEAEQQGVRLMPV